MSQQREQKIAKAICAAYTAKSLDDAKQHLEWMLKRVTYYMEGEMLSVRRIIDTLNDAIDAAKEMERFEQELSSARGPVKDAIEAYGDEHGLNTRRLNWRGAWMSPGEVVKVAKAAVPGGYNEWTVARMARAISALPSGYQYAFARESSVCLYIKGFSTTDEVVNIHDAFKKARADEIGIGQKVWDRAELETYQPKPGDEMRIWWD